MSRLVLAAALVALPTVAPAKPVRLMLDWFVNPDHAPIIIAAEKGFFADEGLEVEIIPPADPSDPPKMVASGQVDIAVTYQPHLHLQVHEGLPVIRIGTLVATPLNCVTVLADSGIESVADLAGKTVGYSVPGVETALMGAMLRHAGLPEDAATMVNVSWSLTPALLTGQVDATLGGYRNFELTQMALEGAEGRCLFVEEQGIPSYDELVFIARKDGLDKEMARHFMAAIERGAQWTINHPTEAWQTFVSAYPDLDDELNHAAWDATLPRFSQSPAALDHGRYAGFEAFLIEAGLIDSALPVSDYAMDPGQ
ncbi:ABC transporter substrate-binding protein [Falsirhodobacter sp. alg1]|uniref:ABC transporter substrate-binding protein n=1 Tax=Falsirhodobacter sp. alg1 TaxID=1472418 RepID=UPI0005ED705E|nr:ABC transporter substrate-binding protein [Falsirhodobacter sp. alg1]